MADSTLNKSDQIVAEQRDIQHVVDSDTENGAASSSGATQAGAPFPKQHQPKPGEEAQLDPAPMYDAPYYRGSGKLQDKATIVTAGDSGIGRSVAVLFAREGADVAIVYLAEHEDARVTKAAVAGAPIAMRQDNLRSGSSVGCRRRLCGEPAYGLGLWASELGQIPVHGFLNKRSGVHE